jgi:hypothetical protein
VVACLARGRLFLARTDLFFAGCFLAGFFFATAFFFFAAGFFLRAALFLRATLPVRDVFFLAMKEVYQRQRR